jgi:hypothetical protein
MFNIVVTESIAKPMYLERSHKSQMLHPLFDRFHNMNPAVMLASATCYKAPIRITSSVSLLLQSLL